MIRSMTGFGQAARSALGYRLQVDVRSVNHRYAEYSIRLPREWLSMEETLRKTIQQEIKRGRIDVHVSVERESDTALRLEPDWELAEAYLSAVKSLSAKLGLDDTLSVRDLLQLPNLFKTSEMFIESNPALEEHITACTKEALGALVIMREKEGKHLLSDLSHRLLLLIQSHQEIMQSAPHVAAAVRDKLRTRIQELLGSMPLDESRLQQEIALFADRSNIDEELTRLQSHFTQFEALLAENEPTGRRLDFLIQEMNREVNTIGSKANQIDITNLVVGMKAELEKIREQVQNIE